MFGAFLGGAAKGAGDELDNQEAMAFKLKLQNAQIEGELANAKKLADYNSVDPNTAKKLREWSGIAPAEGPMNAASASAALGMGKARSSAEARAARQFRPQIYKKDNKVMTSTWETDPETGARIRKDEVLGVDPTSYREYAKFKAEAESTYAILDDLEEASKKLLTNDNYIKRVGGAAKITIEDALGSGRPEVVDLASTLQSKSLAIAAVINKGRPSDTDKIAVQEGLVKKTDSLDYALRKIQALRNVMDRTDSQMHKMLIEGDLSPADAPKKAPHEVKAEGYGSLSTAEKAALLLKKLEEAAKKKAEAEATAAKAAANPKR